MNELINLVKQIPDFEITNIESLTSEQFSEILKSTEILKSDNQPNNSSEIQNNSNDDAHVVDADNFPSSTISNEIIICFLEYILSTIKPLINDFMGQYNDIIKGILFNILVKQMKNSINPVKIQSAVSRGC